MSDDLKHRLDDVGFQAKQAKALLRMLEDELREYREFTKRAISPLAAEGGEWDKFNTLIVSAERWLDDMVVTGTEFTELLNAVE